MSGRTILDWELLSAEDLERVEKALDRWEAAGEVNSLAVSDVCSDPKLVPYIEERLRDLERVSRFFSSEDPAEFPAAPKRIGPVRIVKTIARGIVCDVYLGQQQDPLRDVAVKVVHSAADDPKIQRSFKREVGILAKLNHVGIGKVHFAGTDGDERSRLYFAMEFVDGVKLTEYAERESLSIRNRAELFIKVCDAIGHAHQHGVIHRDLKPANILVANDGQPKILDFGISSWVETSGTRHSQYGLGTPGYMSPEQVDDDGRQDTRGDIYSLGVILYELLCGQLPYAQPVTTVAQAISVLTRGETVALSKRLPGCGRDLEAISQKCLQRRPDDRYQSVQLLAEDLKRYLSGDAVIARPPSFVDSTRRFANKHRLTTSLGIAALLCLLPGSIMSFAFWRRAEGARSELSEELARRRRSTVNHVLANADRSWRASPDLTRRWLDDAELSERPSKSFAWRVQSHRTERVIRDFKAHKFAVKDIAYLPYDAGLITSIDAGEFKRWNLETGELQWTKKQGIYQVRSCSVDPHGGRLLFLKNNGLSLCDADSGMTTHTRKPDTDWGAASFSPAGDLIIAWNKSGSLAVLDSELRQTVGRYNAPFKRIVRAAIDEESSRLMAISPRGRVVTWSIADGTILADWQSTGGKRVRICALSDDFRSLAMANPFAGVWICRGDDPQYSLFHAARGDRIDKLRFSFDGEWLMSTSRGRIHGRSRQSGWRKQWTRFFDGTPTCLESSKTGETYAVGFEDGTVQHCTIDVRPIAEVLARDLSRPRHLRILDSAQRVIVAGNNLVEIDLSNSAATREIPLANAPCADVACDSERFVNIASGKSRQLMRVSSGADDLKVVAEMDFAVQAIACDAERDKMIAGLGGGRVSVFRYSTAEPVRLFVAHPAMITSLAIHRGSGLYASGSENGQVALWNQEDELVMRWNAHNSRVSDLVFSPSGDRLFSASFDRTIGVFDVREMQQLTSMRLGEERVRALAISPDGDTLAIGTAGPEITLCDAVTRELQATLQGHTDSVTDLQFTRDGRSLLSVSLDGTLQRWRPQ